MVLFPRSMWRNGGVAVATGALVLTLSGAADAEMFWPGGPFLDKADLAMADQAARKLLEPEPAPLGRFQAWSNPASGNSGKLTMGRAYEKNGNACRAVSWFDSFKSGQKRTVLLDTCRIAGEWKLM